jgi:Fe-S cluster biosynthesis and repair protein YggX
MADGGSVVTNRIEQFRKMAEADPENELGHFSLGRAYLDAGMNAEAGASLERAIQLNPNLSRAYHLMATALSRQGLRVQAIARLVEGVRIAERRGDMMPRNEMLRMLQDLGGEVPADLAQSAGAATRAVGQGEVQCRRCGRVAAKMPNRPFSNAQGQLIHDNICADCWREWIHMGTKVINELRLPLNDPQAQRIFDQHMMEFLNLRPNE